MSKLLLPSLHKSNGSSYIDLVRHTRPGNLVGYWPLNETSGSIAHDLSGNGFHGTIYGCLLGQEGILPNERSFFFDGVDDYINVYSSAFANLLGNGYEFSAMAWFKLHPSKYTYTATQMRIVRFILGTQDGIIMRRNSGSAYTNGSVYKGIGISTTAYTLEAINSNYWNPLILHSKGKDIGGVYTVYSNGRDYSYYYGNTFTRDKWLGNIDTALIGSATTTPTELWHGWLSHIAIWNCSLHPKELRKFSSFGRYGNV